ncbi:MAG: 30S ribosomal protein S27e [Candidatus Aenigmarchaeota archaeon]|nr:30S ribosomal protein S27e [Candidatus Aenigmarchaeota archaeon]
MKRIAVTTESKFIKLLCRKCKNEQVTFSKASSVVKCLNCEEVLVVPTGGKAEMKGKKIQTLT